MQITLTIGGFDPSSGAGITADLAVFAAHGLFGTSAITALTVQSTVGVLSTYPVTPDILRATLSCIHADLPPAGIKIGMLATVANVAVVCDYVESVRFANAPIPIVLDPVLRSSSGKDLLESEGIDLLTARLLPLVDWVTPNLAELQVLTGSPVTSRADLPRASKELLRRVQAASPRSRLGVFATGGHLDPPDDLLLTSQHEKLWLGGQMRATEEIHGTGCALSSAFLSNLVLGKAASEAAKDAKLYVATKIESASSAGRGARVMSHLGLMHNPSPS